MTKSILFHVLTAQLLSIEQYVIYKKHDASFRVKNDHYTRNKP